MSKTYKDDQKTRNESSKKKKSESQLHKEYVDHKREKRLENALRSCDVDILCNEDFQNV